MAKTNKGRKFFATTATAALVASAIVPVASAAQVNDYNSISPYAQEAVQALVDRGVIQGDEKGNFNPKKTVTRAEAATILTKALELSSTSTVNFTDVAVGAWYYEAVAAAVNAGIFEGQGAGKFNPSGNLTRSEAAIILVEAFKLEGSSSLASFKDEASVKTWAKEALEIAVANGVLKGDDKGNLNPNAPIVRQDFALMYNRTEVAAVDPATNLVDALEELKTATEKVTAENVAAAKTAIEAAEKALEAAKKAEVVTEEEVKAAEAAIAAAKKVVADYEESLLVAKVESVTATNLKEVVVTFNRAVDKESAEDKAKYSLKSGKVIKSATLKADGKTVVLTLETQLTNNKAEAVSVSNVKAGDKTVSVSNFEFNVFDNEIPAVTEVKTLGTKAVKVVFSEPVKDPKQANFTLDGKAFYGKVNVVGNEVILTPYTALTVGEHTLQVSKVNDYAGFTSITSTNKFTVVEDKEAPKVDTAEATLETLTLTFSEDVDVDTVSASKVYWKSGDSKKTATSVEQVAGNKFKYTFAGNNTLPTGSVTVYVEGVKDYSGNSIAADTKVVVTPEIDQTRPEVKAVKVVSATKLEVTFSKNVETTSAQTTANYTVLDKDGKVIAVKSATANNNVVTVELYSSLSTGDNKLTIKNVKDNTKLQNTMLDYSETIVKGDTKQPSIDSVVANSGEQRVVIGFDEKMDVATLTNYSNYLVNIDGQLQALTPDMADLSVLHDGKVLVVTFVEKIGGKSVSFTSAPSNTITKISQLQVLGVKDAAGNLLSNFTVNDNSNKVDLTVASTTLNVVSTTLVDSNTVEVKFDAGIVDAPTSAITNIGLAGQSVESIDVDGSSVIKVNFTKDFSPNASDVAFDITAGSLETLAGKATAATLNITSAVDKVAPAIAKTDGVTIKANPATDTLVVTFNEAIKDAGLALVASDLEVRVNGTLLDSSKQEFTVSTGATPNDAIIEIQVLKDGISASSDVTVALTNGRYIQDLAGNTATTFTATQLKTGSVLTEKVAPTAVTYATNNKSFKVVSATEITVVFSEELDAATFTAAVANGFAVAGGTANLTKAELGSDNKTVTLTGTNFLAGTTTVAYTAGTVADKAGNTLANITATPTN